MASSITVEELREELQSFAEISIRTELEALQRRLVDELRDHGQSRKKAASEAEAPGRPAALLSKEACHGMAPPGLSTRELTWDWGEEGENSKNVLLESSDLYVPGSLSAKKKVSPTGRRSSAIAAKVAYDVVGEERSLCRRLQGACLDVVASHQFEQLSAALVLCNALWIGYQTDFAARNWTKDFSRWFVAIDCFFCFAALFEVLLRVAAFGSMFFSWSTSGWKWNWFDVIVVMTQLTDQASEFTASTKSSGHHFSGLRIIKLVRVLRIARIASVFPELHVLISSIVDSLYSLFWVLVLIIAFLYAIAIFITQMVTSHKINVGHEHMESHQEALLEYYGTLDMSMVSLYMIISEGIHWGELVEPLAEHISPWTKMLFVVFTGFMLFAMMNVITACFVDNAMKIASQAEMDEVLDSLWQMLGGGVGDHKTNITMEVFMEHFYDPGMQRFTSMVGAEGEDPTRVFTLIDQNGDGELTLEEFLTYCTRIMGGAKAIQVASAAADIKDALEIHHKELVREFRGAIRDAMDARLPAQASS